MAKRPAGGRVGGRAAKRPRRRRLYLVTEDWKQGYSIREVDLMEDHGAADSDADEQDLRRLPAPVLRLEAPHNGPWHFAAAFGTKIMALHLTPWRYTPVFDVQTRCLTFGPPTIGMATAPVHVPVGDSLYKFGFRKFHVLCPPPPRTEVLCCDVPKEWSWRCLSHPFGEHQVTSHAVHPDGRTLFASVRVKGRDMGDTFTCDTDADDPKWTAHREWELPFKGPGHYDPRLDAWVGLTDDPATAGHICCCQVPSPDDVCSSPPAWKLSREKLFCRDPAEAHTGASLVYLGTGHRSRFCLVECLSRGSRRHQLRLTTFSPRMVMSIRLWTASAVTRLNEYTIFGEEGQLISLLQSVMMDPPAVVFKPIDRDHTVCACGGWNRRTSDISAIDGSTVLFFISGTSVHFMRMTSCAFREYSHS